MRRGDTVLKQYDDRNLGTVLALYKPGRDKHGVPHTHSDALVEWSNGITNYERQDGLRLAAAPLEP